VPVTGSRSAAARSNRGGHDLELEGLLSAARGGDREALGSIWLLLSPRVHGYVRGRGARSPDDVTSEIFLAVFSGLHRFEGDAADFRSWLFTIAHHKVVDEFRRRVDESVYIASADPRRAASAEAHVLHGIVEDEVRDLLAELTAEQREVLLLRALGDLSLEQVAVLTGRSVGAVKQLHHRAVAAARRVADHRGRAPRTTVSASIGALPTRSWSDSSPAAVTRAASTAMTDL
jgi:RNA polymerase sigma-70 factor (ECF subfamily)